MLGELKCKNSQDLKLFLTEVYSFSAYTHECMNFCSEKIEAPADNLPITYRVLVRSKKF